jgi:hypothetical protein
MALFPLMVLDRGFQTDLRSDLKAARSSDVKSPGSSQADELVVMAVS